MLLKEEIHEGTQRKSRARTVSRVMGLLELSAWKAATTWQALRWAQRQIVRASSDNRPIPLRRRTCDHSPNQDATQTATTVIHMILEACDKLALTRGMRGLMVRIARAVNRAAKRPRKVFADHYFARELPTPAEVRRAVRYVLDNAMLHAGADPRTDAGASNAPVVAPRTWLLAVGWLRSRAGPLPVSRWSTLDPSSAAAA